MIALLGASLRTGVIRRSGGPLRGGPHAAIDRLWWVGVGTKSGHEVCVHVLGWANGWGTGVAGGGTPHVKRAVDLTIWAGRDEDQCSPRAPGGLVMATWREPDRDERASIAVVRIVGIRRR